MTVTPSDAARAVLDGPGIAHLVTLDPDGSPQVSAVWVGLDGDDVVFASMAPRRKITNLQRDPRVAFSVQTDAMEGPGLQQHLVVHGTATVTEGGAADLLQHLAHTYLGPDAVFPGMADPPAGFVVHIAIDRVSGVGPWTA